MQLLSVLILMQCLVCIFLQECDAQVKSEKLYAIRSQENIVANKSIRITFAHKRMHAHRRNRSLLAELNFRLRDHASTEEESNFAFNLDEYTSIKSDELLQEHTERPDQRSFCYESPKIHRRNLLVHSEEELYQDFLNHVQLHGPSMGPFHQVGPRDSPRDLATSADGQRELWDEWGSWSSCSVSCGNGRQVRWRHCSGGGCTKGLKKAQIKMCTLKSCESKNILNWLGIKSK